MLYVEFLRLLICKKKLNRQLRKTDSTNLNRIAALSATDPCLSIVTALFDFSVNRLYTHKVKLIELK